MATIQLGKLVSVKEAGLSEEQRRMYDELRVYHHGPFIVADLSDAIHHNDSTKADEVYAVAIKYLGDRIHTIITMYGIFEFSADLKRLTMGQVDIPEKSRIVESLTSPSERVPYDRVYDQNLRATGTTIQQIDTFLLSRL